MKSLLISAFLILGTAQAFAGPKCTTEPKNKWKDAEVFKKSLIDEGYKIKVYKTTPGNCYEIYGLNKDGKKVEIYFNPVTGEKTKENFR